METYDNFEDFEASMSLINKAQLFDDEDLDNIKHVSCHYNTKTKNMLL